VPVAIQHDIAGNQYPGLLERWDVYLHIGKRGCIE